MEDFITPKHRYFIELELVNPKIFEFNPVLKHYTGLDTRSGSGELYLGASIEGDSEVVQGKVKPILKNLDILYKKDNYEDLADVLFQHLGAFTNVILSNPKTEGTGTIIEFKKRSDEIDISSFKAFMELLKNAFVQALKESIP